MKKITKEWIKKAESDYSAAQKLMKTENPEYDIVCFLSQQSVEKYLKSLLQENDIFFEKTHNLDVLLELCKKVIPELIELKESIVDLSSFSVEIRYPGIEATEEEAKNSLQTAEKVREILRKYFGLSLE